MVEEASGLGGNLPPERRRERAGLIVSGGVGRGIRARGAWRGQCECSYVMRAAIITVTIVPSPTLVLEMLYPVDAEYRKCSTPNTVNPVAVNSPPRNTVNPPRNLSDVRWWGSREHVEVTRRRVGGRRGMWLIGLLAGVYRCPFMAPLWPLYGPYTAPIRPLLGTRNTGAYIDRDILAACTDTRGMEVCTVFSATHLGRMQGSPPNSLFLQGPDRASTEYVQ